PLDLSVPGHLASQILWTLTGYDLVALARVGKRYGNGLRLVDHRERIQVRFARGLQTSPSEEEELLSFPDHDTVLQQLILGPDRVVDPILVSGQMHHRVAQRRGLNIQLVHLTGKVGDLIALIGNDRLLLGSLLFGSRLEVLDSLFVRGDLRQQSRVADL